MTITTNEARELRKRITKLVNAERADEMRGAKAPEDWPAMDERLRVARKRMHEFVETLKQFDGGVRP